MYGAYSSTKFLPGGMKEVAVMGSSEGRRFSHITCVLHTNPLSKIDLVRKKHLKLKGIVLLVAF